MAHLTIASGKKLWPILLIFGFLCTCSNENKKISTDSNFRLITHNIWNGFTEVPDQKAEWAKWIKQKDPDLLVLQELNGYTPEQLKQEADFWEHPYSVMLKSEGFPTGITSRYPIEDVQRTLEGFHHGLLRVQIKGIYVYVIHLHPSNWKVRMKEIDQILQDVKELPPDARIILAGDFNALSRSDSVYYADGDLEPFFRQRDSELNEHNLNHGELDYTVFDKIMENEFSDTELLLRSEDYHFTGSFPTSVEKSGNHGAFRRLDYIFVNKSLIDNIKSATIVSNKKTQLFSDHLPVMIDFKVE